MALLHGVAFQVFFEFVHGHDRADQRALALEDADFLEELELFLIGNALCAHVQVQRIRHVLDGDDSAAGHIVLRDAGGEALVQLQQVEMHLVQQRNIGIAGSEVAHDQRYAPLYAGFFQAAAHLLHKELVLREFGQQVQRQRHIGVHLVADPDRLAHSLPQNSGGEKLRQRVVLLHNAKDGPGRQQVAFFIAEVRHKHLVRVAGVLVEGPFGLALQHHGVLITYDVFHQL